MDVHFRTRRPDQIAHVGSADGRAVVVELTPAAAEQLAKILVRLDTVSADRRDVDEVGDPNEWTHVAIDLLATATLVTINAQPPVPVARPAFARGGLVTR